MISLSDGRICYLDCTESTQHLPPESIIAAVADIRGRPRLAIELPNSWESMQEVELRRRVETVLHALHAGDAPGTPVAAPAAAPVPRDTRGFLARLFGLWPQATRA